MPKDNEDSGVGNARRAVQPFQTAGSRSGAATAVSALPRAPSGAVPAPPAASAQLPAREALETLTAAEADALEAIVARLIPSDENGLEPLRRGRPITSTAPWRVRLPLRAPPTRWASQRLTNMHKHQGGSLSPNFPQRIRTRYCGI
jgi:hypothetical protein